MRTPPIVVRTRDPGPRLPIRTTFQFLDAVDQFSSGRYGHWPCSFRILDLNASPFGVIFQWLIFDLGGPVRVVQYVTGKSHRLGFASLKLFASQSLHGRRVFEIEVCNLGTHFGGILGGRK